LYFVGAQLLIPSAITLDSCSESHQPICATKPPRTLIKAIFPVAGLGTRFLPATKSIPKEIMTLIDRALIQYPIDEAAHLRAELAAKGKTDLLKVLASTDMDSGAIAYNRQTRALGLGHAVWCARRLVGNEAVAVLLPDDVIAGTPGCLKQMVEAYSEGKHQSVTRTDAKTVRHLSK
jgi:UTP--glucose-1-phosphate uridylyltransferase